MSKRPRPLLRDVQSPGDVSRRERARAAMAALNARRDELPKCRATSRTTGGPCGQLAMANGCCRWHGGRTPKGQRWHRPVAPDPARPDAAEKATRKANDLARAAEKRSRRLDRMTDEERAAHAAWQASHRPGDPKARAAIRERRRQDRDAAAQIRVMSERQAPRPYDPERQHLDAEIAARRARLVEIEAERQAGADGGDEAPRRRKFDGAFA